MRRPRTHHAIGRLYAGLLALTLGPACSPRAESSAPQTDPEAGPSAKPEPEPASAASPEAKPEPAPTLTAVEPTPTPTPEPELVDPLAPLPDEVRQRFASLPADPKPEALIRNSHYWVSNEMSQFLWRDHIAGLGGALLGVGSDQNYLLAGWAQSDLIVVVDFDLAIADLHQIYAAFFDKAETPDDFIAWWSSDNVEQAKALLEERYSEADNYDRIKRWFKVARQSVSARLRGVKRRYLERGIATFVSDQAQYDHIRTLSRNGRVFAVRGDFTGDNTMVALAEAMQQSGQTFGVIYLSNVEQYIDYGPEFRRNLMRQPVGEKAVVIRTLGWSAFGFADGEEYHYNVQKAPLFAEWLEHSRVKNLPRMLHWRTKTDTVGLSLLDGEVRHSKRPPIIAE